MTPVADQEKVTALDPADWLRAARTGGAPEPVRERWQPLRVGIVNLWEYDDTEFWFADGRLVLRGGNGTGKTKVLELTTLMLLRGEITPPALDPFGSRHRTMRFNLLPSGEEDDPRPPADTGLGYAWAEFGRLDDEGQPRYLTFGLGAVARRGAGTESPERWMFRTARRIGTDLVLASPTGPLPEKELREQRGVEVIKNAEVYRRELARELFAVDPSAYGNLTELLKQLRRPKLGERLNPKELERTLRDALPELATDEVTQLAEGWDRLEELRLGVEKLENAAARVAEFVRRGWLPWVRMVVRGRADELASATTRLDDTTRDKRKAQNDLATTENELAEKVAEHGAAKSQLDAHQVRLRELLESNAYRDAVSAMQRVEALRHQANREQEIAAEHRTAVSGCEKWEGRAREKLLKTRTEHDAAVEHVEGTLQSLRESTTDAGLITAAADLIDSRDVEALRSLYGSRIERLNHLTTLHARWEKAQQRVDQLDSVLEDRDRQEQEARTGVDQAQSSVERATAALEKRLAHWVDALDSAPPTPDQVSAWHGMVEDASASDAENRRSLCDALGTHLSDAQKRLRDQREELRTERHPFDLRKTHAESELESARSETDAAPPEPGLWKRRRRPEASAEMGAPFWRCVQPRADVDSELLAGLEATLAAAGLLDAWLATDGTLLTDDADTFFAPAEPTALTDPTDGPVTLTAVLEPTPNGGVTSDRIAEVLSRITWHPRRPPTPADEDVWLAADGSWSTGALTGRAVASRPAAYLGATAREQARQRRIEALESELTVLDGEIAAIDSQIGLVREQLDHLDTAREELPRKEENALVTALARLRAARDQHEGAEQELTRAVTAHDEALGKRDRERAEASSYAADHAFPLDRLDDVRRALDTYNSAIGRLEYDLARLRAYEERVDESEGELSDAAALAEEAREKRDEAIQRAEAAEIKARTAEESVGTDYETLRRKRENLEDTINALDKSTEQSAQAVSVLRVRHGRAETVLDSHEQARAQAEQRRETAIATLWRAADEGLVSAVGVPVPDSRTIKPSLEMAQEIRKTIREASTVGQERAWRQCYAALQQVRQALLPTRDAILEDEEDGDLPRISIQVDPTSGRVAPNVAAEELTAQVQAQRNKFDAEQQRVLTRLLESTFIEHLKERLDYTESVFTRINGRLVQHPTRQGHTLRLRWEADADHAEAGQVVEALRQGYEHLAENRQAMVRAFLKRRIEAAREQASAEGIADWQRHLAIALDYRRWLRIGLEFRPGPGARWRPFDAARHGSKSGGEKVILLSQPLFAAAVVAYDAAGPHAPRMVWLDEAMTGVDSQVKADFMGLTVEFDLDLMLTAHDEWCRYASVPAVAVYDLSRQRFVPGVDAMPYLWCGGDWQRCEATLAARRSETASAPADEGLF
ncbi:TIGR02680 family protein [Nocardiopsis gilva]|uniref:TIGR02680 family protein n=1 Tax=Nocardiopsis gilva TaxID=280236 RepID=UPI00034801BC|nr:TIGR02680 family protein [Nocardiopsis gilva]